MILKTKYISDKSGSVVILLAVILPLLLGVVGIAVDIGRIYAVQSKVQNAADAALLGAVATASTTAVNAETLKLFNVNFPTGYMGSTVNGFTVTKVDTGMYTLTFSVSVPTTILKAIGSGNFTMNILSRVESGYQLAAKQSLELALVFDNSGAANVNAEQNAGVALRNVIFGGSNKLNNVHITVIPYDTAINLGVNQIGWIQAGSQAKYNADHASSGGLNYYVSNRNPDAPPNVSFNDVTDVIPNTNNTEFRVPYGYGTVPPGNGPPFTPDYVSTNKLAIMQFGMNTKVSIQNELNLMKATGGNERINVGLMWGWFALSPNWQGKWSPALPGLPAADSPLLSKQLVLVVTGKNNVYTGVGGQSNDDATTSQLCQAIQSKGIIIYTVGFGAPTNYNATLLQQCATSPSYFFTAASPAQLTTTLQAIADDVAYSTLRISQ